MMYPVLGLLAISLVSFLLQLKNNNRFTDLIHFLLFMAVGAMLLVKISPEESVVLWVLMAIVAINFVTSHIGLLRKQLTRAIVPLLSLGALILFMQGKSISYIHESGVLINKFFILAALIAVIGYELASFKSNMAAKLFGLTNDEELIRALFILFMGAAIFFGGFQSGSVGVFAITALLLSASFYREHSHKEAIVSLLPIVVLPIFVYRSGMGDVELTEFDVLEGLFYGAFSMYFIQKLWDVKQRSIFITAFAYIISIGLAAILLFLGSQFLKMGGIDAVIGAIVGASLVNMVIGKGYTGASFIPLLLVTGFVIPRFLPDNEAQELFTIETPANDELSEESFVSLNEITGEYQLVKSDSKVTFVMGEKGETKGAFKSLEGAVEFTEDISSSMFDIELNTSELTTFNEIRDESVMSEEYLHEAKFPLMKYKGNKLTKIAENEWKINGEFTMLGVSKPVEVTVQGLKSKDQIYIVGKGEIDRREFGMPPSSSEGNIVTFEYKALLKSN